MNVSKHIFLSLAIAFAAAGCGKTGDAEVAVPVPDAVKSGPDARQQGTLPRFETMSGNARQKFMACMAKETDIVLDKMGSTVHKAPPTLGEREAQKFEELNRAMSTGRDVCAGKFGIDRESVPLPVLRRR